MEYILNKNIFNDKVLDKLSPDYNPRNFLARIQLRRNMKNSSQRLKGVHSKAYIPNDEKVKDTHNHRAVKNNNNNNSLQRKIMKRTKDLYKINKEIVDIRNGFNNMNLKNRLMLKEAVKNVEKLKTKDVLNLNDEEYMTLRLETEPYVEQISEDMTNMIISNDDTFKVRDRLKISKANTEPKNKQSKIIKDSGKKATNINISEEMLRVQCTFNKSTKTNLDFHSENEETDIKQVIKTDDSVNLITSGNEYNNLPITHNEVNKHVDDLQTLLLMMAISPKSNDVNRDCAEHFRSEISDCANSRIEDTEQNIVLSCKHNDITQYLNITPIRIEINDKETTILKKYVTKWRNYVSRRKEYVLQQRQATLNSFFDKLEKKKINFTQTTESYDTTKLIARDFSTYQHRYKIQKHIIALQKAKLEEQNRIIEQLKFNKIIEASRQSVDALREEVRKTYYDIDRQLKPKIKCMSKELKLHDIEEPALVLHCLKVPQFLQRMEKRAREREEKHAMIRERRQQMEEERLRLKQQAELSRAEMDKEEKIKRMKELKDKRKREKIESIRKKQHTERMRALKVMADLHYEKNLMTKYGIRPLRMLIEIKRDNIEKAKVHYKFQLKKNVFLHWMWYTEDMWFDRNYKADDYYRKTVLRRAFRGLKQNHHEFILKKQVAEDYYDLYITQLVFRRLREGIELIRKENEAKLQKAVIYYNSELLFKTFTCWRTLPALSALKREQEARKARWRQKVLQVVPDYTPPDD